MVPWLAQPPCVLLGKALSDYLITRGWTLTSTRKIIETCGFGAQNIALFWMCHTNSFVAALICMTIAIAGSGFHSNGVMVNPQDLAPAYSGSVFGLMNTVGAIPGKNNLILFQ